MSQKGISTIAGVVIGILVLGTAFGVWLWWANRCPECPQALQGKTANWKTYRNEKYGLEMKYPKETYVDSCDEDGVCYKGMEEWFAFENAFNNRLTEFKYVDFGPQSTRLGGYVWGTSVIRKDEIESRIKPIGQEFEGRLESRQNISVNGQPALLVTVQTKHWISKQVFIEKGDSVFEINNNTSKEPNFETFYTSFVFIK